MLWGAPKRSLDVSSSLALVTLTRAAFVWCAQGRVRLPHPGKGAAEREGGRECAALSKKVW